MKMKHNLNIIMPLKRVRSANYNPQQRRLEPKSLAETRLEALLAEKTDQTVLLQSNLAAAQTEIEQMKIQKEQAIVDAKRQSDEIEQLRAKLAKATTETRQLRGVLEKNEQELKLIEFWQQKYNELAQKPADSTDWWIKNQ